MRLKTIKSALERIWQVLIFVLKDRSGMVDFGAFFPPSKVNEGVFDTSSEIVIDGKKYLVERHFTGNRDFRQAVYSAVENEAKRADLTSESA